MLNNLDDLPSKMIEGQPWIPLFAANAAVAKLRATAEVVERNLRGAEVLCHIYCDMLTGGGWTREEELRVERDRRIEALSALAAEGRES